jgi:ElaB/YqjD/DUF883 family membrane-anchored ribosome-binding protein
MNEVEKHYATQPKHPSSSGSAGRQDEGGFGGTAKRLVEGARGTVEGASGWAADSYERAARSATYARRRSAVELGRGRDTVGQFVEENPIMVGVVGLAAGLLVGALLPGTRRENELLGRYADEVRDQGLRYAQELAGQGRQLVEENLSRVAPGRSDRDLGDETSAVR